MLYEFGILVPIPAEKGMAGKANVILLQKTVNLHSTKIKNISSFAKQQF